MNVGNFFPIIEEYFEFSCYTLTQNSYNFMHFFENVSNETQTFKNTFIN